MYVCGRDILVGKYATRANYWNSLLLIIYIGQLLLGKANVQFKMSCLPCSKTRFIGFMHAGEHVLFGVVMQEATDVDEVRGVAGLIALPR